MVCVNVTCKHPSRMIHERNLLIIKAAEFATDGSKLRSVGVKNSHRLRLPDALDRVDGFLIVFFAE